MNDTLREILSKLPLTGAMVDSPEEIIDKQLQKTELARRLQDIEREAQVTQEKRREQTPARFIFGHSPEETGSVMSQIFKKDVPTDDLVSGKLDSITSGIDAEKQKIQADQTKFGNANLSEYKTYQQAEKESDYTPKIATKEDEIATGGRVKAGTATTEGSVKVLAALERTRIMANSPGKTNNFEFQNKKFLVDTLQNRKAELARQLTGMDKTPGYLKTSPDFQAQYQGLKTQMDSVDSDINSLSGLNRVAPSLQPQGTETPPPAEPPKPREPKTKVAAPTFDTLPAEIKSEILKNANKIVTLTDGSKWKFDGKKVTSMGKK